MSKNITVTVDDDAYRAARVKAAHEGTSVSRVVADFLWHYGGQDDEVEARKNALLHTLGRIDASGSQFSAADRLSREDLYDSARRR